jgi:hypothetical protein
MWIFTKHGFYSVVQKNGEKFLTVRARVKGDLDKLREQYIPELTPTIATDKADYPFRAMVLHEAFSNGMQRIAKDIDYHNFKYEVAADGDYERARIYGKVWGVVRDLEDLK